MESNYCKGWSEGAKGTLNLAVSIHCPIMINLSRMFAIKKKESDVSLFNTDLCMCLNGLKVDAFFSIHSLDLTVLWSKMRPFDR